MLKEAKDTQGINSGGSSNDNMALDFSTPQSHAINDGRLSSVISNRWCERVLCYLDPSTDATDMMAFGALSSGFIYCTLSHNKYYGNSVTF